MKAPQTPQEAVIRANDAKALLENPLLKDAFSAVYDYLRAKAESCDPDNKDRAQAVVLSMKLLAQIRAEIERHVQNGVVAEIQIAQLERKKFPSIFKR